MLDGNVLDNWYNSSSRYVNLIVLLHFITFASVFYDKLLQALYDLRNRLVDHTVGS